MYLREHLNKHLPFGIRTQLYQRQSKSKVGQILTENQENLSIQKYKYIYTEMIILYM